MAGFVAWLRLPPEARDGRVAVLSTVEHHCSAASVNRKLAALTSFCEFHARHGVALAGLLVTMQPTGRRGAGSATSYKPFLHHVTKNKPERRRTIKLKTGRPRPKVLAVKEVQAILDACDHLRDRLLFALLLDCGVRIGEALGLRHEDMGIAERAVTVIPRANDNRARAKAGVSSARHLPWPSENAAQPIFAAAPATRRGRNPQRSSDPADDHVDDTVHNESPQVSAMIISSAQDKIRGPVGYRAHVAPTQKALSANGCTDTTQPPNRVSPTNASELRATLGGHPVVPRTGDKSRLRSCGQ
ncbi:tyrosine-type recombinase/integrase [Pseudarthrobacter sp. S9]|uniref:tyrosine-type recombinase/integrase n=1 Tax=Pseudarthrobacter sp. S9 TaxID=3418421 RepID=UPI003CFCDD89